MVGRTKPQKKMDSKVTSDIVHLEITYLKAKNSELAKALAECKATLTQIVEDRDMLQRQLFSSSLRCTKLENYIKMMQNLSRACMSAIVTASTHTTQLLETAHDALNVKPRPDSNYSEIRSRDSPDTSNTANKTQAVKPMIGGHVILRPTINLRRVNEFSHEELQQLQSDTQLSNSSNSLEETNQNQNNVSNNPYVRLYRGNPSTDDQGQSFSNIEEAEYNGSASSGSDLTPEENERLDTVQEERDDDLQPSLVSNDRHLNSLTNGTGSSFNMSGNNSQVPLLSGVFRDVRVYLSPIQNLEPHQHITKERGSQRYKTQRSHSMSSVGAQEHDAEPRSPNFSRSSLGSAPDDSYTALQNSLMAGSKVSTPNHLNLGRGKINNLSWVNLANKYSSSFKGFSQNSAESSWNSSKEPASLTQTSGRSSTLVDAGDPLEGPSTLLDNNTAEFETKIEIMNGLGLIPTLASNSLTPQMSESSTPPTPSSAVVRRRRERLGKTENKKMVLMSGKTARVVVNRVSLSKAAQFTKRKSRSPIKSDESERLSTSPKKSLDGSNKRSISPKSKLRISERIRDSSKGTLRKRKKPIARKPSSLDSSRDQTTVSPTSTTTSTTTNKKSRTLKKIKVEANNSPSRNISASSSPVKRRLRLREMNRNFKEPSLTKKLRRSK